MVSRKELRKVLANWEIGGTLPIGDAYVMNGTRVAGNLWTVGTEYILKTGERGKLLRHIQVCKALEKQGFAAAAPLPTKTGGDSTDGAEPYILMRRLKGAPLPMPERTGVRREAFGEKYGRSIARLHKALKAVQSGVVPDEVNLYQTVTEWALPDVRRQNERRNMGIGDEFFEDYVATFGKLYPALPRQLIHRDPHPGNILFDNGEVSGFLDFDLCESNVRLWDACYCATGILSECAAGEYGKWLDVFGGILRGYHAKSCLSAEEKQAVFYVVCSIQMVCIAYFESRGDLKELAETNRRMLRFILENREAIRTIASAVS